MFRQAMVAAVLCTAAMMVGCDKKVRLTFTNLTDEPRQVELVGPYATQYAGTVAPAGGKLPVPIQIKKGDLPADIQWRAGDINGVVTVQKDTPDKLWVDIRKGGAPTVRGKDDEIKETKQKEIRDRPIHQGTVVE